jgi:hypothetical protein
MGILRKIAFLWQAGGCPCLSPHERRREHGNSKEKDRSQESNQEETCCQENHDEKEKVVLEHVSQKRNRAAPPNSKANRAEPIHFSWISMVLVSAQAFRVMTPWDSVRGIPIHGPAPHTPGPRQ